MRPAAFLGALIGAALGALVWAGIATWTGLEIGWVAWGLGGLVGFGAALLGGEGATTGAACAVLALLAIFVGKWIAVDAVGEREVRKFATSFATMDVYEETRRDAEDFAELVSEDEYPEFMIVHGYTDAEYEDEVDQLELVVFRQESVPMLRRFHTMSLPYAQWREHVGDEAVRMWNAEISNTELVKESLSGLDALFALLGLVTAFQVGARGMGTAAIGADEGASPDRYRAPDMHGSRYGDTNAGYASREASGATAPILQDEPPNPYAHPGPGSQPAARPSAPAQPPTIARLDQAPQAPRPEAQPEEAATTNPYA